MPCRKHNNRNNTEGNSGLKEKVTRFAWRCLNQERLIGGRGNYWNYYKGHMDKTKGEGGEGGGRWVQLGWGGGLGRKGTQL